MNAKMNTEQLKYFLEDYEQNATIEILEEGKDKSELFKVCKARGIDLENNKDLTGFKCVYAFANKPNSNGAYLPEQELLKALPTMIGKPVNLRHDRSLVVGHLLDYVYKQSEKKVISYGVFYRSCFKQDYKEAKKDFKIGELNVSFEIWSPKNKRVKRKDGSYELHEMEVAGMAILPRDTDPSFKDAKMLEFASKDIEEIKELVFASNKNYNQGDIINTSNYYQNEVKKNAEKIAKEKEENKVEPKVDPVVEPKVEPKVEVPVEPKVEPKAEVKVEPVVEPKVEPIIPKLSCSHCNTEFVLPAVIEGDLKCQKCFAIIDKTGKMLFPPQIIDFKMACQGCGLTNWKILSHAEKSSNLKCMSCAKEYKVDYKTVKENTELDMLAFMYLSTTPCLQCGTALPINGTCKMTTHNLTCPKCKLTFTHDIKESKQFKQIESIQEILEVKTKPASEEPEVKPKTKEEPVVEPKVEPKVEVPVEPKVEPKAEVKVEPVVEPKVEAPKKASVENTESLEQKPTNAQTKQFKEDINKIETASLEKAKEAKNKIIRKAVNKILKLKKDNKELTLSSKIREKVLTEGIKKVASKLISAKAELKKIQEETDKKIKIYLENAKKIVSRRNELGTHGDNLTDKDILNQGKFVDAKLAKENNLVKASATEVVGDKKGNNDSAYYERYRKEINEQAYGEQNEKKDN